MTYRIIHYSHILNGNICLEIDAAGVDLGVKITEFDFTPVITTTGMYVCNLRPSLNPLLCLIE